MYPVISSAKPAYKPPQHIAPVVTLVDPWSATTVPAYRTTLTLEHRVHAHPVITAA